MITVSQAYQLILETFSDLKFSRPSNQKKELNAHPHTILGEDIIADRPSPPFDKAMMDGFALMSRALSQGVSRFRVTGLQSAGQAPGRIDQIDQALEIATGAPLPFNADCVVPYENTSLSVMKTDYPFDISLTKKIKKMDHVQSKGKEYQKGDLLIAQGTLLKSTHISVLAATGKKKIRTVERPSIGIIITGDELTSIETKPRPWQIRESNGIMISSFLKEWGFEEVSYLKVQDDLHALTDMIQNYLAQKDWVIITGSLSKGKRDFVPTILERIKADIKFYRVKQKPGKPFLFATKKVKKQKIISALPGNPVSALVCLRRYLLPAYFASLKHQNKLELKMKITPPILFDRPLTYFPLVTLDRSSPGTVRPVNHRGSGDFYSLTGSDGFIEMPSQIHSTDQRKEFLFYPWNLW